MKNKQNAFICKNSKIMALKNISYALICILITFIYQNTRKIALTSINKAIEYILCQPIGIKHNRMLKIVFGKAYKSILDPNYCIDVLSSLKICCRFVFIIYRQILKSFIEVFELLNNKTYNHLMKRYDTIYLNLDQIVLAVLLFAVILIIFMNLIILYGFFVVVYLTVLVVNLIIDLWEDFTAGYTLEYSLLKLKHYYLLRRISIKGITTGNV